MADKEPNEDLEVEELQDNEEAEDLNYHEDDSVSWRDRYSAVPDWAKNVAKIVAGIIILLVIVLVGRTIHHHLKNDGTAVNPPAAPQVAKAPVKQNGANSSSGNQGAKSNSGLASKSTSSASTKSQSAKPSTPPTTVPDTGPGDVAAVFLGATAVAAVLHYGLNARRANR